MPAASIERGVEMSETVSIGTCDDCGAEDVEIWHTEYNWQCAKCKAENDKEEDNED
jgi:hypothetical protein